MVWRCFPAHQGTAVIAIPKDEDDVQRLLDRGWVTVRGERAVIIRREEDEVHNAVLRILFDRKYPYPHP